MSDDRPPLDATGRRRKAPPPAAPAAQDKGRTARLAAALRENLHRRKARSRAADAAESQGDA
ncbi:MAG: hypothetical protein ACK4TB_09815 [Gemmobacter sp.]